jgi:putative membrane protein
VDPSTATLRPNWSRSSAAVSDAASVTVETDVAVGVAVGVDESVGVPVGVAVDDDVPAEVLVSVAVGVSVGVREVDVGSSGPSVDEANNPEQPARPVVPRRASVRRSVRRPLSIIRPTALTGRTKELCSSQHVGQGAPGESLNSTRVLAAIAQLAVVTTASDRATEESTLRGSVPPLREWARTFVVGLFMGTADAVPGVSGGTIALIAGIYERLIAAITNVTPGRAVRFLQALNPLSDTAFRETAAVIEEVDAWFLVALLAGVVSAVVTVTRVVHVAEQETPALLFGAFFGLIAASAVILLREISVTTGPEAVAALSGFLVAFLLSGAETLGLGDGLLVVFVAGAIGVSAMILPGISGSLLLIILGQYIRMTEVLSEFVDALIALATGGPLDPVVSEGTLVVTFVLGGLVGLFTIARAVRRALDWNREVTFAFLVALVVGALRAPVQQTGENVGFSTDVLAAFAAAAVVGAVVVLILDWYAVDIDLDDV